VLRPQLFSTSWIGRVIQFLFLPSRQLLHGGSFECLIQHIDELELLHLSLSLRISVRGKRASTKEVASTVDVKLTT